MNDEERARLARFVADRTPALMRIAYLLTGDRHEAEDLLQTALLKTALRWGSLRHDDPEGYVRTVMYREQVGTWRRLRRRHVVREQRYVSQVDPDPNEATDVRFAMRSALKRLSAMHRAVVVLRFYEDLTETQVAEVLGCSVGTVRSRTNRAIVRLRQLVPDTDSLEVLR
ncbi:SigE family RNA polymerase sigma factor [Micromonospora deserti]|uniref:SigE family RNA polymerase sigma factor n=1 Tax=Micromonospora deserti TaxID=2070366 RepID=A0A2W2B686_9ACTN|nr:SigE family RNA polymerase sigma factor [Micromonospora deserti]PZF82795.1 SigE family RNA polymerase sigma factor [Micromonospora deserti]